jgi:hypothetical protein
LLCFVPWHGNTARPGAFEFQHVLRHFHSGTGFRLATMVML